MEAAVKTANTNIHNYVQTSPAFQQAGSTLTAAVIRAANGEDPGLTPGLRRWQRDQLEAPLSGLTA